MNTSASNEITQLLSRFSKGDQEAEEQVVRLLYKDLRRLAKHYLAAERRDHTLQATALVHEAYLRISRQPEFPLKNRSHFFAAAARAMRRILVDHARGVNAVKRGGVKIPLETSLIYAEAQSGEMLALDEALERLASRDPRQAQVVEMKFFGGLSLEEIAEVLNVSTKTIKRDWNFARSWLYAQLSASSKEDVRKKSLGKS